MHEDFSRETVVKGSSDRSFGLVMAACLIFIALLPLFHHGLPRWWALVIGVILALLAVVRPNSLSLLNRLWTKLGLLLSRVVTPIVLGLIFYLAVTPIGLLLRTFGKDLLKLRASPEAQSYWVSRRPPGPAPQSMKQQF